MKKTILAMAFVAVTMVSCQDKTKDKVEDATEAVGNDVEQEMDTLATETGEVIDTVQAKTGEVLEEGGEKLKEASKK